MNRPSLDILTDQVITFFQRHARRYGLRAEAVQARYILNWGGFVNASFHVTDGERAYHLKLADDEEMQERLEQWKFFAPRLTLHYHAPRLVDWVNIPHSPFAGLLFDYIPGRAADLAAEPEVRAGVIELLARLHADQGLAAALETVEGPPEGCGDYFMSVYIDRFDEDLLSIAGDLPPFVPLPTLDWMQGETRELEGLARDLPAFQQPANAPTHGDLWQNNILVTPDGAWYVIDWDDMALGDPALEYSILLGPLLLKGVLDEKEARNWLPKDADFNERFAVCQRALLLDQVIDTLADWVEVKFAPEHIDTVRAEKERQHRTALEIYRRKYPG